MSLEQNKENTAEGELGRQIGRVIEILREGKNRNISVQGGVDDAVSSFTLNVFRGGRNLGLYHGKSEELNDPEEVARQVVMWAANRQ